MNAIEVWCPCCARWRRLIDVPSDPKEEQK